MSYVDDCNLANISCYYDQVECDSYYINHYLRNITIPGMNNTQFYANYINCHEFQQYIDEVAVYLCCLTLPLAIMFYVVLYPIYSKSEIGPETLIMAGKNDNNMSVCEFNLDNTHDFFVLYGLSFKNKTIKEDIINNIDVIDSLMSFLLLIPISLSFAFLYLPLDAPNNLCLPDYKYKYIFLALFIFSSLIWIILVLLILFTIIKSFSTCFFRIPESEYSEEDTKFYYKVILTVNKSEDNTNLKKGIYKLNKCFGEGNNKYVIYCLFGLIYSLMVVVALGMITSMITVYTNNPYRDNINGYQEKYFKLNAPCS